MSRYYNPIYPTSKPYKYPFRQSFGLILFVLVMLVMSWEVQRTDAAVANGEIPQESIRLRILANSDSPADQLIKRVVRDEIVKAMNNWITGPQTIEEARVTIQSHMPDLERIVAMVLKSRGFDYSFQVELGQVQFPTKMYGSEVYPAGEYEALRVTLGEGKGQNWWCVLFPPLCFIDAATGEASAAVATTTAHGSVDESTEQTADISTSDDQSAAGTAPEAKFFLLEMIKSLIDWIKSLF